MDARKRTARCGCGSLTVTTTGEPADVYACSCLKCQRMSGGTFSYCAVYPEAAVSVAGTQRGWQHHGDSGRWIETQFCPTCGVTVYFRSESWPGLVGIAVGCFADLDFPKPKKLYWASRHHRWLQFPDGIELVDTQPG